MFDHNGSPNIRVKKTFPIEANLFKTSAGLTDTRYSQSFGKFFLNKNKDRINPVDSPVRTNKYSERYLVNINKLQKLTDTKKQPQKLERPQLNRTLSTSVNHDDFNASSTFQKYSSTTSQSHRSHVMTINLKKLPKIYPSSSNFNGSHTKIQAMKEEMNQFGMEVINMLEKTRDFKITFDKTKTNLEHDCSKAEKNMNGKVQQLQKLIKTTQQRNKARSQAIQNDCSAIKQKNKELKGYLDEIESRIQGIENTLGITTGHHKHYV